MQGKQVPLVCTETLVDCWNGGMTLEFLSSFLLRAPPLEMRQECLPNEAGKGSFISSYDAEMGLLLTLAGLLLYLSSADGNVVELLELPQECQGSFQGLGGKVRFLLNHSRGKAPQLTLSGEFPGLSRVAAGLLSSDNGDLRDPLFELQGGPLSTGVARGPSGFLCSRCQG